jgi:hypothetical protein
VVWSGEPQTLRHDPGDFLEQHFPQLVASLRDTRQAA